MVSLPQSPPFDWQMNLANQRPRTNTPPWTVNEIRGRVVFEKNSEALRGCVDRTVSSNSCGIVYFACLSGWSYLSPAKRLLDSHSAKITCSMSPRSRWSEEDEAEARTEWVAYMLTSMGKRLEVVAAVTCRHAPIRLAVAQLKRHVLLHASSFDFTLCGTTKTWHVHQTDFTMKKKEEKKLN